MRQTISRSWADRGYFNSEEVLACVEQKITVTMPKPMTSANRIKGLFVKQDFRYLNDEDVYLCPAGERLIYRYTREEADLMIRRYLVEQLSKLRYAVQVHDQQVSAHSALGAGASP